MTDLTLLFNGGVSGATVAAGVEGVETIVEGSQVFETGFEGIGIRAGGAANTANTRYKIDLSLTGNHFGSIHLRNKTAHGSGSASCNFFYMVDSTNTNMFRLRAKPSNGLSIIAPEPTEIRAGSASEIPVNAWFRFDWQITGTTCNWKTYNDPTAAALSTPSLSGSFTVAGTADKIILGAQSSSAIIKDWSADILRVTNTGSWFGPYAPPPAGAPTKLYNGTAEVALTRKLYNGSSEVAVTSKIWNGTAEV